MFCLFYQKVSRDGDKCSFAEAVQVSDIILGVSELSTTIVGGRGVSKEERADDDGEEGVMEAGNFQQRLWSTEE